MIVARGLGRRGPEVVVTGMIGGLGLNFTQVQPVVPPFGGGRATIPDDLMTLYRLRLIEDDELIAVALIAAMPGLMRRH